MCKKARIVCQTLVEETMGKVVAVTVCEECGWRDGITPEMVSRYERDGFPTHCGKPVKVDRVGSINGEQPPRVSGQ